MAKIKYDVTGVDSSGGPRIKPGMYRAKIKEIEDGESKSGNGPMMIVQFEITAESTGARTEFKGQTIKTWILLAHEPSAFRLREFLEAIGKVATSGKKGEKGTLDTATLLGTEVQINVKSDKDQDGEYMPRVGKILALEGGDSDEEPEEGEEEEPDGAEPEEAEDDEEAIDLDELDRAALKALIKEENLDIRVLKSTTDDALREAIAEKMGGDEEPEDEEPEEEEEPEAEEETEPEDDGLDETDRAALKKILKDEGIEFKVFKSTTDDALREAIREARGAGGEDEGPEYDSWEIKKLDAELKERGLPIKGTKAVKAQRLRKDDESDEEPF